MKNYTFLCTLICLLFLINACKDNDPEPAHEACSNVNSCEQTCLESGILADTYNGTSTIHEVVKHNDVVILDTIYTRFDTFIWEHIDTAEYRLDWPAICDFYQVHNLCDQSFWWRSGTCEVEFDWNYQEREQLNMTFNSTTLNMTASLFYEDITGFSDYDSLGNEYRIFESRWLDLVAHAH